MERREDFFARERSTRIDTEIEGHLCKMFSACLK